MIKKKVSTAQVAVDAVGRIEEELDLLQVKRGNVLSEFRQVANTLADINDELEQKSSLCCSLIAQLQQAQVGINQQAADNDRVRMKILDIIGE